MSVFVPEWKVCGGCGNLVETRILLFNRCPHCFLSNSQRLAALVLGLFIIAADGFAVYRWGTHIVPFPTWTFFLVVLAFVGGFYLILKAAAGRHRIIFWRKST